MNIISLLTLAWTIENVFIQNVDSSQSVRMNQLIQMKERKSPTTTNFRWAIVYVSRLLNN